jgi:hypothetical protein
MKEISKFAKYCKYNIDQRRSMKSWTRIFTGIWEYTQRNLQQSTS